MLALVVLDTVVVALLAVLVAGLLRSHADILRQLHLLGAGVGEPLEDGRQPGTPDVTAHASAAVGAPAPFVIGPPLPVERSSGSAHDVTGHSPEGDAMAVAVTETPHRTLLTFLSSGCTSCAGLWERLRQPERLGLPEGVRVVVVTKGPEFESPAALRGKTAPSVPVVMSNAAWDAYEVPGSPFFVLVDGADSRRIGEGVASRLEQVVDLVRRAEREAGHPPWGQGSGRSGPSRTTGGDGPARERANDMELIEAGILPGDPSLYPRRVEDLFGGVGQTTEPATLSDPARPMDSDDDR